ncbi:hypothetical protein [Amycolatopsis alkalitolerans]|uniref:WXG100 family type VII secretion target n=1 Tax=Amycolatopsis alkalitolerans TaxID=2547244 RepID=A0A5C4MAX8_9PSEU|nr:hypothetical protein [Amycolatopsis alkalitolerans]TNC29171.1 hypothetical protein FG385_03540 [Amycolatopsis alkalitolerans]
MTGQALNTTVNGSAGTCRETATVLGQLYDAAYQAGTEFRSALTTADATWHGPAHDAFADQVNGVRPEIDALSDRAFKVQWALNDFADSLEAILARVGNALAGAKEGGLEVDGPFIVSPTPPGPAPILPTGPCGTAQAQRIMDQNQQAIAQHNQVIADYNAKVAVHNEAKAIVTDARTMEANAHNALEQAVGAAAKAVQNDMTKIAFTTASQARGFVGTMENTRRLAQSQADRLKTQAEFYRNFALGKQVDDPDWAKALLERSAKMADDGGKLETRAQQFEQWVKTVPEDVRKQLTAYPGRSASENLTEHSSDVKLPAGAARIARSLPYVGSILTAGSEAFGAWKGEQSWGRAAADTGAAIAGGALGGALTGAVAGSAFGPGGTLILGVLGGFGGAKFATDIVQGFSNAVSAK